MSTSVSTSSAFSKTIILTLAATASAFLSFKLKKMTPPSRVYLDWEDENQDEKKTTEEISIFN